MDFVYTPRLIECIVFFARFHPVTILPGIVKIPGDGCSFGPLFPKMSEGVAFYSFCIIKTANMIFINFTSLHMRYKTLPDPRFFESHKERMFIRFPVIKIAYNR